jgi:aspartate 1-decarboxylase
MQRNMLKSKIHSATITGINIHYEGSIGIDPVLMEKANIIPFEKVEIANINNGNRFSTYVIEGKKNSGEISLNGAAARLGVLGDLIIIFSYVYLSDEDITRYEPVIVLLDENNKIKFIHH